MEIQDEEPITYEFIRGYMTAEFEIADMIRQGLRIPDYKCKYCGSRRVRRYGRNKSTGIQRLQCCDCKRTFMDTESLPGMKKPAEQVAAALNMYYEGMSLNAIRRHLKQMYNSYPSDSTVYDWISKFTKIAIRRTKDIKPEVGDVWVADETVLKIGGKNVWFWDLIDAKTRFLLASHLSESRTQYDARLLMHRAAKKAGKPPKVVITDKLAAYIEGVSWNFGKDTKHMAAKQLTARPGTQLIERFHSTLKARTKVMRGLKHLDAAREILQGWLVHYNYLRPHETLGNIPPAKKAGVDYKFQNWKHIVNKVVELPQDKRRLSERKLPRITPLMPRISPKMGKLR